MNAWLTHFHWSNARGDRSPRQVAVADYLAITAGVLEVAMRFNPLGHFRFDRSSQHLLSAFAKDL
jgi:hypothetical protein